MKPLPPASIIWNKTPGEFKGDIGAAVNLSAQRWSEFGATFAWLDDEGEAVRLASATIGTSSGPIAFGILDYGDEITYLLFAASGERNEHFAAQTLEALFRLKVLSSSDILTEGGHLSWDLPEKMGISLRHLPKPPDPQTLPQGTTLLADPEVSRRLATALAHPLRVQILLILNERSASPPELASELNMPMNHVAYHFRRLEWADLIEVVDTVPRRGAMEHFYRAVRKTKPS